MLQEDNAIRRMDLNLRSEIYGLKTEIYKIAEHRYAIYCLNLLEIGCLDFEQIQKLFDEKIRFVTYNVSLTSEHPQKYLYKLDSISLDSPVYEFKSTIITEQDLREAIRSRFHDASIKRIHTNPGINFSVEITVASDTDDLKIKEMHDKLLELDIGTDDIRICKETSKSIQNKSTEKNEKEDDHPEEDGSDYDALSIHINNKSKLSLSETEYWINNASSIYDGEIKRAQLPYYRVNQKNCYIDASVFDCIDIRKAILLYDTVYLALPIENHLEDFLDKQRISRNELIELCGRKKLVIILNADERRYDQELITEIYSHSPSGIIGQRGVNTLVASYFVNLEERFKRNYPGIEDLISELYKYGREHEASHILRSDRIFMNLIGSGQAYETSSDAIKSKSIQVDLSKSSLLLADALSWPMWAKTESFKILNGSAPIRISNFGVNSLVLESTNLISDKSLREKIQFEYIANAHQMHIAMALNSTYIPFYQKEDGKGSSAYSDYWLSASLEKLLSFYWYNSAQLEQIESMTEKTDRALKLFDAKDMSVLKIAEAADNQRTSARFGKLVNDLSNLPEKEQEEKIGLFNDILYEIEKPTKKINIVDWTLTGTGFLDLIYPVSFGLNLFSILIKGIQGNSIVKERQEKKEISKQIVKEGKNALDQDVDDIYLLDKINRVVSLRVHR